MNVIIKNLENIEMFFDYNLKIKSCMKSMAMNYEDSYNSEAIIQYEDKLFKKLNEIELYLSKILLIFNFGEKKLTELQQRFERYRNEFMNANSDAAELRRLYEKNISNMDKAFLDSVKSSCVGYYLFRGSDIKEPGSVNEYLRLLHSSIVNNENTYQQMPLVEQKSNSDNDSVSVYGNSGELVHDIFRDFPMLNSRVDILNLKDRILIMARDLGHATMIEISHDDKNAIIRYFIPKVCNYLMVNELKGITKVKQGDKFANGVFEVELSSLKNSLYDLVSAIPTDLDMDKEGGLSFDRESKVM